MDVCEACGGHARRPDSPEKDLRGRDCPKFGHVHRGCCREEACSTVDARGAVRCGWDQLTEAQRRRHRDEAADGQGSADAADGQAVGDPLDPDAGGDDGHGQGHRGAADEVALDDDQAAHDGGQGDPGHRTI